MYEVKLVAYNGNGESDGSTRLVSLVEEKISDPSTGEGEPSGGGNLLPREGHRSC